MYREREIERWEERIIKKNRVRERKRERKNLRPAELRQLPPLFFAVSALVTLQNVLNVH